MFLSLGLIMFVQHFQPIKEHLWILNEKWSKVAVIFVVTKDKN